MTRFGICNYDMDGYKPKIENLEIFDNYYNRIESDKKRCC